MVARLAVHRGGTATGARVAYRPYGGGRRTRRLATRGWATGRGSGGASAGHRPKSRSFATLASSTRCRDAAVSLGGHHGQFVRGTVPTRHSTRKCCLAKLDDCPAHQLPYWSGHEFRWKAPASRTATLPPRWGAPDEDQVEMSASAGRAHCVPGKGGRYVLLSNAAGHRGLSGAFPALPG